MRTLPWPALACTLVAFAFAFAGEMLSRKGFAFVAALCSLFVLKYVVLSVASVMAWYVERTGGAA